MDADQTAADLEQTEADSDQTSADADQAASNADQARADRDQHASDRDQAAADWERSHGSGAAAAVEAYEASRVERDESTLERESTATGRSRTTSKRLAAASRRDEVAYVRDLTAAVRDRTAQVRDSAAGARDRAAVARERQALRSGTLDDSMIALRGPRALGASIRGESARERTAAKSDREAAAGDRERAAADRRHADLDDLTAVFRRGAGELALTHEIHRSRRQGQSLVVALIDVDSLKAVNDSHGHAAGDALLRNVAAAITSTLRSYDVAVRWGGDEFVCAVSDVTLEVASERLVEIGRTFTALHPGASISVGLAQLTDDDALESLIARADTALYQSKAARGI
jgi:diguanylate cyclase (GGDEF)-like protein